MGTGSLRPAAWRQGRRARRWQELGAYGADKVLVCESDLLETYTTDAYAKVLCDTVMAKKPEILLIAATNIGRDLGPRQQLVCTLV